VTAPGQPTGGLADTLNILLDKGLVIDASVKVLLIGIELVAIEARIVISSVDTYIRFLEAMQRLEVQKQDPAPRFSQGLSRTIGLIPQAPPTPAIAVPAERATHVEPQ